MIGVFLFAHFLRLVILKRQVNFISIRKYTVKFAMPAAVITVIIALILGFVKEILVVDNLLKFLLFVILSVVIVSATVYIFALNTFEKSNIKLLIKK